MAGSQEVDQRVSNTVMQRGAGGWQLHRQFDDAGVTRHLPTILVSAVDGFWLSRPATMGVSVAVMVNSDIGVGPRAEVLPLPGPARLIFHGTGGQPGACGQASCRLPPPGSSPSPARPSRPASPFPGTSGPLPACQ